MPLPIGITILLFLLTFLIIEFGQCGVDGEDGGHIYQMKIFGPLGEISKKKQEDDNSNVKTFNLVIDTSTAEESIQQADIVIGQSVTINCNVIGETDHSPSLLWLYNGGPLSLSNGSKILVATADDQLSSTLAIDIVDHLDGGSYECSIKTKLGVRKSSKIKFEVIFEFNLTQIESSEESWCGPTYDTYCKNRGVCLYHKTSKILTCKCQPNYFGAYCQHEYISREVHVKYKSMDFACQHLEQRYTKNVILIGCLCIFTIILTTVGFLYVTAKKLKKQKRRYSKRIINDDSDKTNKENYNYSKTSHVKDTEAGLLLKKDDSALVSTHFQTNTSNDMSSDRSNLSAQYYQKK